MEHFGHKRYYPRVTLSRALKGALGQRFVKKVLLGSTILLPKSNITKRRTPKSTITKWCSWGALCQNVLLGSTMLLPKSNVTKRTTPKSTITKGCSWEHFAKRRSWEHNATIQEQHPTAHYFTMRCVTYLYDNILIAKNKHLQKSQFILHSTEHI